MDIRQTIFANRSYTPIPFIILLLIFARPTFVSILLGLCLAVVGETIRFWGVSIAGSETRTTGPVGATNLITQGPFAYVRNPLYVGNMLMYLGTGIMANALMPFLLIIALAFFGFQYALIVGKEEEYLRGAFGEEYERYTRHVPRFVPRLTPYAGQHSFHRAPDLSRALLSERRTLQAFGGITLAIVLLFLLK